MGFTEKGVSCSQWCHCLATPKSLSCRYFVLQCEVVVHIHSSNTAMVLCYIQEDQNGRLFIQFVDKQNQVSQLLLRRSNKLSPPQTVTDVVNLCEKTTTLFLVCCLLLQPFFSLLSMLQSLQLIYSNHLRV